MKLSNTIILIWFCRNDAKEKENKRPTSYHQIFIQMQNLWWDI